MNKNSLNPSILTNLLNGQMNNISSNMANMGNFSNLANLNSQITAQMKNRLKNNIENKAADNNENGTQLSNIEIENLYLKSFILNKMNSFLATSSLGEKLTLYNIISPKDEGIYDYAGLSSGMPNNINNGNNLNSDNSFISGYPSLEKHFQKEVVKYTIENFCKFLKSSGYTITKDSEVEENSDKESSQGNPEIEDVTKLQNEGHNEFLGKKENTCPHTEKRHYAKNMCNACYHRNGRVKKAWLCAHSTKIHYARGKCRNCYLNTYHKVEYINFRSIKLRRSLSLTPSMVMT